MHDLQRPTLDKMVGDRERGQAVRLTGSDQPIPVHEDVAWDDFETLTVSSTALQIPEALRNHDRAFITVESQIVRYRVDGGIPTATVGIRLLVNERLDLHGKSELDKFRVIRQDGSDATVRVTVGLRV